MHKGMFTLAQEALMRVYTGYLDFEVARSYITGPDYSTRLIFHEDADLQRHSAEMSSSNAGEISWLPDFPKNDPALRRIIEKVRAGEPVDDTALIASIRGDPESLAHSLDSGAGRAQGGAVAA